MLESTLYVVGTPIGNLEDITQRALRVLREVDLIAAEDTRVTQKLLAAYGIHGKNLESYYDQVEVAKSARIVARMLESPYSVALVSDAGTPGIADPGYQLVGKARDAGIRVVPIPGPSSVTSLMSVCGLPNFRFTFIGFLPEKPAALEKEIGSWSPIAESGGSIVFLESTRRLKKALQTIQAHFPKARLCIGRELTKQFEETVLVGIDDAVTWTDRPESHKGEVTVVLHLGEGGAPAAIDHAGIARLAAEDMRAGTSLKDLLQKYRDRGLSRTELYQLLLEVKSKL